MQEKDEDEREESRKKGCTIIAVGDEEKPNYQLHVPPAGPVST